jgi:hypothetical protein
MIRDKFCCGYHAEISVKILNLKEFTFTAFFVFNRPRISQKVEIKAFSDSS